MNVDLTLQQLADSGNLRRIPSQPHHSAIDLSSNDYLGLAERTDLRDEFFATHSPAELLMSSSASRLLGAHQREFQSFEELLHNSYGRPALTFNSGYHANVGLIQAIADNNTLIVADRLVHASIIDGIRLSGAPFVRFRHNDYDHLNNILDHKAKDYTNVLIIAESVYSMDGDSADIDRLIEAKRRCGDNALLYIDEAHAVGVAGPAGLGLVTASS
ncbi:MAG: aminotransferase class I/II-fold pyridoxal phosphate-dependent enzyme, partial [Muribaculaceae bacterium]|nr:aminotransferase class I/II-fold pyridoxal phosphate-dependent enzyme [Muribaculaceae bacterium]